MTTVFFTSTCNPFFPRVRGTLEERFWAKVMPEPNTGCWLWCGDGNAKYGNFGYRDETGQHRALAHKFSYELHKGAVPDGLEIDHKCRTSFCVNPQHLEAVTRQENIARIPAELRGSKPRDACKNGHPLVEGSFKWVRTESPYRLCLICMDTYSERARRKKGMRIQGSFISASGLTPDDVRKIRSSTLSARVLAEQYGIGQSSVFRIKCGEQHGNVPDK